VYGKLYNYYAVADIRNVCPAGWHVPAHDEWIVLQDYLGGWEIAGGKLKERGTVHWKDPNTGATNENGFTALPAPFRFESGNFVYELSNYIGFCWSSSLSGRTLAKAWYIVNNSAGLNNYPAEKNRGYSVRCLKN
jgi:uncharacterized protein (TIGR02145 family)